MFSVSRFTFLCLLYAWVAKNDTSKSACSLSRNLSYMLFLERKNDDVTKD